ncbi:MAG TPA: PH domain-containing protein [Chthoniobacter sp.]|nr:PH domain-containing protein [Chthoniobacter sp.]
MFLAGLVATFFVHLFDDPTMLWIVRGVLGLIALILMVWIRVDRSRRKYTVTNRRVSVEFGIVSKSSTELRIQDIRSINLTTAGLSGLAGIGRVEFSSAASDDADVIFWNAPGAEKIRDLVRSLQTPAGASPVTAA